MRTDTWHECYSQPLTELIVPEAFAHPAKMSWTLVQRIMGHLGEEWPSVRAVVDPMAGVGVVGLAAAYSGYTAILGELEGHFSALAGENIALHTDRLRALGKPVPVLFRHDAQHIPLAGAGAGAVVTSPPFADSRNGTSTPEHYQALNEKVHRDGKGHGGRVGLSVGQSYGTHPAQVGNMRAVVTSPPFADIASCRDPNMRTGRTQAGGPLYNDYGSHPPQLGNDNGTDYWSAMAKVYLECARILPPGAPMILVVKGYISKGQYVDLPMQTAQLVDSCGFEVVHWHHASLVSRDVQLGLFGGETRRERKSFFRRLAEKNGAPPIDAEIVLCAERRGEG